MAPERAPLPRSELEILRIVWDLGSATVRAVADRLPSERALDFWTVQTYLRRLQAKGYLQAEKQGRQNIYRALVKPEEVMKSVATDLVERLAHRALPLVQHLIEDAAFSADEIKQLQQFLRDLKAQKH